MRTDTTHWSHLDGQRVEKGVTRVVEWIPNISVLGKDYIISVLGKDYINMPIKIRDEENRYNTLIPSREPATAVKPNLSSAGWSVDPIFFLLL